MEMAQYRAQRENRCTAKSIQVSVLHNFIIATKSSKVTTTKKLVPQPSVPTMLSSPDEWVAG